MCASYLHYVCIMCVSYLHYVCIMCAPCLYQACIMCVSWVHHGCIIEIKKLVFHIMHVLVPDPFEDMKYSVIRKLRSGIFVNLEWNTRYRDIWRGKQVIDYSVNSWGWPAEFLIHRILNFNQLCLTRKCYLICGKILCYRHEGCRFSR